MILIKVKSFIILFVLFVSCHGDHDSNFRGRNQFYDESGLLVRREFYSTEGGNGSIFTERTFKDDTIPHGYARSYYVNGQLMGEEHYINGVEHGIFRRFYPNGQLEQIGRIKNGVLDSLAEMYYENGNLKLKTFWMQGKQIAEHISYFSNGEVSEYLFYSPIGDLVYKSVYDQNGGRLDEEGSQNTHLVCRDEDYEFFTGDTLWIEIFAPSPPDKKVVLIVNLSSSLNESFDDGQVVPIKNGFADYKVVLGQQGVFRFNALLTSEDFLKSNSDSFSNSFSFSVFKR
jgi:antitoxin component YwqK of YwqJK toxin-antitoxin module